MRKKEVLKRPVRRKYSYALHYISEIKAEKENQENEINLKLPGLNFEKLLSTKGSKRLFFSAAKHNIGFTTLPHKYFIEFYV